MIEITFTEKYHSILLQTTERIVLVIFFPVSYYLKMESYLISGAYPGFFCGGTCDAPSLPDTQAETWRRNRDIVHTAFVFILENQAVND